MDGAVTKKTELAEKTTNLYGRDVMTKGEGGGVSGGVECEEGANVGQGANVTP